MLSKQLCMQLSMEGKRLMTQGLHIRGRQMLWDVLQEHNDYEEVCCMAYIRDLSSILYDDIEDELEDFLQRLQYVLQGIRTVPEDSILYRLLLDTLRESRQLPERLEFHCTQESTPKTCAELMNLCDHHALFKNEGSGTGQGNYYQTPETKTMSSRSLLR